MALVPVMLVPVQLVFNTSNFFPTRPMRTNKQKILSRTKGTITIDIPPIPFPTPITAVRWLATNPVMRALYFVVMGIGIGHFLHSPQALPTIFPPVITVTETLEDFVARESQGLTAEERHKLIAVTETILGIHFETPSEMREAFRYERRRSGIDSPAFTAFSEKWEKELDRRQQTADSRKKDSVEEMRSIYESLLRGLKVQAYSDKELEVSEEIDNRPLSLWERVRVRGELSDQEPALTPALSQGERGHVDEQSPSSPSNSLLTPSRRLFIRR